MLSFVLLYGWWFCLFALGVVAHVRCCFFFSFGILLLIFFLHVNILRSRPLRRTCSAYRPTSQPFSARNCWRGNYLLGTRTFPKWFASLLFVTFFFCFFPRFFFVSRFSSYENEYLLPLYVFGFPFCIHRKIAFHLFLFVVFFLSSFRFSLRVTREDKARQQ